MKAHHRVATLVFGMLAVFVSGCSTTVMIKDRHRDLLEHAVFIESKGIPAKLLDERRRLLPCDTVAGQKYDFDEQVFNLNFSPRVPVTARGFGCRVLAIERALRREIAARKADRTTPVEVVIVLHGGRNTLAESMDEQDSIVVRMRQENAAVFPILVKYESEDLSSYAEHLLYTRPSRRGPVGKAWRVARTPLTLVWDFVSGVGRIPLSAYQQISREYSALVTPKLRLSPCTVGDSTVDNHMDHFQIPTRGQSGGRTLIQAGLGTLSLATRIPVDVLVASLGPGEWESMKRRAQVMMTLDHNYIPEAHDRPFDRRPSRQKCPEDGSEILGAVGIVLAMLDSVSVDHPDVTVSILAHSTGAIVACNLIHSSRGTSIQWKNIVFMAAACTINDFDYKVRPMLEDPAAWQTAGHFNHRHAARPRSSRNPAVAQTRFFNLCLHPTAELQEFGYPAAFFVRGTLLTWIDDFLAPLGTFRDRTLGRAENAVPYINTLPYALLERCYLKVFDFEPMGSACPTPRKHSDFMRVTNCFWRESFWTPDSMREVPVVTPDPKAQQAATAK